MIIHRARPKAREALLTADHREHGHPLISVLNPVTNHVVLLDPWEHAVLLLCNGTRTALEIVTELGRWIEGEPLDLRAVRSCLALLEQNDLVEPLKTDVDPFPVLGPKTLVEMQRAFSEWHKDPVKTKQILIGLSPPFVDPSAAPVGLAPTIALPEEGTKDDTTPSLGTIIELFDQVSIELGAPEDADPESEKPVVSLDPTDLLAEGCSDVTTVRDARPQISHDSVRHNSEPRGPRVPTASRALEDAEQREVAILQQLSRAGLRIRSHSDEARGLSAALPFRRRNTAAARRFEQAMASLSEGDIDAALHLFRFLVDLVPNSDRLRAFAQAMESACGVAPE